MFHHPAWAIGSYSSSPLAGGSTKSKSTDSRSMPVMVTLRKGTSLKVRLLLELRLTCALYSSDTLINGAKEAIFDKLTNVIFLAFIMRI